MQTNIPDNCGNSPRSLLSIEIAINLAANDYDKLETLLAEDFSMIVAGGDIVVDKTKLKTYLDKATQSKITIDRFDVFTSISHGKYAAVSSRAYSSNGFTFDSHDLYEFTSAGGSAKLRKVTSYVVDSKH